MFAWWRDWKDIQRRLECILDWIPWRLDWNDDKYINKDECYRVIGRMLFYKWKFWYDSNVKSARGVLLGQRAWRILQSRSCCLFYYDYRCTTIACEFFMPTERTLKLKIGGFNIPYGLTSRKHCFAIWNDKVNINSSNTSLANIDC